MQPHRRPASQPARRAAASGVAACKYKISHRCACSTQGKRARARTFAEARRKDIVLELAMQRYIKCIKGNAVDYFKSMHIRANEARPHGVQPPPVEGHPQTIIVGQEHDQPRVEVQGLAAQVENNAAC